jgi:chromosome segregation ATPase
VIELVMVFALGFLVAGLAALAFAPIFWARAVRLSVRRLEMQLPLSMREILADRDQVRAESAVEQRRIEIKAEALNQARSNDLAELGRRAIRITQMQEHIAGLRQANTGLNLDLGRLSRAHAELSAEASALTKELYDLDGLRNRENDRYFDLVRAHNNVLAIADEQKASIASLSACSAALEVRLTDTERSLNTTKAALCNKEAEATLLSSHLERARDDLQTSDAAHQSAVERYEREKARGLELDGRFKEVRAMHEELSGQHRALSAKLEAREGDLREATEREKALQLKHESLIERMHSNERGLADRIDRLRAENAALQGALGAARQECSSLSRDLSALRGTQGKTDEGSSASESAHDEAPLKAHSV